MERETRRKTGKILSTTGCVLFAAFAVLQLVMLFNMLNLGLYNRSPEDAKRNMQEAMLNEYAWNISEYFDYMDQEDAEEHAELLYGNTNANFTVRQNGKVIYEMENWTGAAAKSFEFDYEFYDDYDESDTSDTVHAYTVTCFIPEDYVYADELAFMEEVFDFWMTVRYGIFATLSVSVVAAVILFVIAVKCTGTKQEDGRLRLRRIDRVPLDLYIAIMLCLGMIALAMLDGMSYGNYQYGFWAAAEYVLMNLLLAAWTVVVTALLLQFAGSCRVRARNGHMWRNSLCYRLVAFLRKWFRYFRGNTSLLVKGILIFCGIGFLEFAVTMGCWYGSEGTWIVLFLLEKLVLLFVLCVALVNMKKLKEAGKKIAAGDLKYQTDTGHMLWEFREFGGTLNQISDGMQRAVEEQMKSERFRTELITNVSHDIKTPLTSIINYVDLLSREEQDNPNTREYLEVLERQSARLKKLIEDLIEASKASSGTLGVQWEDCQVGVMLTQAAGEYEERLQKNELELILHQPEEPMVIRADGRHLWRVFDNLLNNVTKYAQPGTRVYLDLERQENQLTVIFRNTSRYALHMTGEELVQRFTRGDSSRNTEGSGLGLSIAQSLTELMGGGFRIVVDGDLFKVVLTFPCKTQA